MSPVADVVEEVKDVGELLDMGERIIKVAGKAMAQASKKPPAERIKDVKRLARTMVAAAEAYLEE